MFLDYFKAYSPTIFNYLLVCGLDGIDAQQFKVMGASNFAPLSVLYTTNGDNPETNGIAYNSPFEISLPFSINSNNSILRSFEYFFTALKYSKLSSNGFC